MPGRQASCIPCKLGSFESESVCLSQGGKTFDVLDEQLKPLADVLSEEQQLNRAPLKSIRKHFAKHENCPFSGGLGEGGAGLRARLGHWHRQGRNSRAGADASEQPRVWMMSVAASYCCAGGGDPCVHPKMAGRQRV